MSGAKSYVYVCIIALSRISGLVSDYPCKGLAFTHGRSLQSCKTEHFCKLSPSFVCVSPLGNWWPELAGGADSLCQKIYPANAGEIGGKYRSLCSEMTAANNTDCHSQAL